MNTRHPLLTALAIPLLSAVLFAACSDGNDPAPTATPTLAPTGTALPEPTGTAAPFVPAPLAWEDCSDGFECADIVVPVDYADPAGPSFTLPMIRRTAEDADNRIGSLLVNPGGPGVSGVDFVRNAYRLYSEDVRERFDIVGWDPRGVAGSVPSIDCVDDLDEFVSGDPSPETLEEAAAQDDAARAFADACAANHGELLAHLTTENTARDMDAMRVALGDEKLTYFGYSYGTFLGAIYADLFPDRIRALVLDAALDPSITAQQDAKNQVVGFEDALSRFLADCAADDGCAFYSGGDPGAAYDALMASLEETPIDGDGSIDVGVGIAELGVISALYSEFKWPSLAEALALAEEGDGSALLDLSDFVTGRIGPGEYSDELEQRIAINCVDGQRLTRDERASLGQELAVLAPRFGEPGVAPSGDPCEFWAAPSLREPKRITSPGSPPILVVGTTGDPATPYQQAVSLAEQLSQGVLLTLNGEGHTAYGGLSGCIDDAVDAYLIDLVPPPDGAVCD